MISDELDSLQSNLAKNQTRSFGSWEMVVIWSPAFSVLLLELEDALAVFVLDNSFKDISVADSHEG